MEKSLFQTLNDINVNGKTEKKNGLTYLSWAFCWAEVKKVCPDAQYTIYERETEYGPVNYFTDGKTCWVKTGVTLNGLEHIEMLPVMDNKNRSIPAEAVTSMDVNKTIQRSLTKACARHGLGLYIYAGEDLPENDDEPKGSKEAAQDVGEAKIEAMRSALERQKCPATDEQRQYIQSYADDETAVKAIKAWGPNLERMTYAQAEKLIARINAQAEAQ